jgi:hypothetical protein
MADYSKYQKKVIQRYYDRQLRGGARHIAQAADEQDEGGPYDGRSERARHRGRAPPRCPVRAGAPPCHAGPAKMVTPAGPDKHADRPKGRSRASLRRPAREPLPCWAWPWQ